MHNGAPTLPSPASHTVAAAASIAEPATTQVGVPLIKFSLPDHGAIFKEARDLLAGQNAETPIEGISYKGNADREGIPNGAGTLTYGKLKYRGTFSAGLPQGSDTLSIKSDEGHLQQKLTGNFHLGNLMEGTVENFESGSKHTRVLHNSPTPRKT